MELVMELLVICRLLVRLLVMWSWICGVLFVIEI
jgi:hypothetical protein